MQTRILQLKEWGGSGCPDLIHELDKIVTKRLSCRRLKRRLRVNKLPLYEATIPIHHHVFVNVVDRYFVNTLCRTRFSFPHQMKVRISLSGTWFADQARGFILKINSQHSYTPHIGNRLTCLRGLSIGSTAQELAASLFTMIGSLCYVNMHDLGTYGGKDKKILTPSEIQSLRSKRAL